VCAAILVRFSEKRALAFILFMFFVGLLFTLAVSSISVDEGKVKIRESPFRVFLNPSPSQRKRKRK
jgi:hypothetical protein